MARSFGISAMVGTRKSRQVLISAGVGLFSGGTQRTALVMRASTSFKPVVGPRLEVAAGEAVFLQRGVEQVAGVVAGERPPGAVGAAQARRQADDQQPRVERPERGHRRVEPRRLALAPGLAEGDEPRTAADNRGRVWRWCQPCLRILCGRQDGPINPRNRRRRRAGRRRAGAGRAAGTAACAGARRAARASGRGPGARTGRGRSLTATRRCR